MWKLRHYKYVNCVKLMFLILNTIAGCVLIHGENVVIIEYVWTKCIKKVW